MKTIQTVRAFCAILFLFCGFLLTRYAAQNEGTWYIVIGCLGILTTVLGIVAVFLFLREFIRGFSWNNPRPQSKMQLASSSFENPDNSNKTKKCPRIGMSGTSMKIYSTPNAIEKHLVIRNQQEIEKVK